MNVLNRGMSRPNAYLLIDSVDRYLTKGGTVGTQNNIAELAFTASPTENTCARFSIQSPGALINGYMTKLMITQLQMNYKIPTINTRNNRFVVYADNEAGDRVYHVVTLPIGFYNAIELAKVITTELQRFTGFETAVATLLAVVDPVSDSTGQVTDTNGQPLYDFTFTTQAPEYRVNGLLIQVVDGGFNGSPVTAWGFLDPTTDDAPFTRELIRSCYRFYRVIGITQNNAEAVFDVDHPNEGFFIATDTINLLYTPYIDIQSFALTQYQTIKDTDTSSEKKAGLVARVYLSGVGQPDYLTATSALGAAPFWVTADLNNPKVVEWTKDVNVTNIDFSLFDQYGEPIFWTLAFNTEFQMSLLVSE